MLPPGMATTPRWTMNLAEQLNLRAELLRIANDHAGRVQCLDEADHLIMISNYRNSRFKPSLTRMR